MDLIIHKKKNKTKITGRIPISGAKNSAVAVIAAALLSEEEVIIHNIPAISDVFDLIEIMKEMGHYITFSDNTVVIKRKKYARYIFDEKTRKLRGSYYLIGAYLAYFRKIGFKSPGGCDLGNRPTNYHLDGFKKLGAKLTIRKDYLFYRLKKVIPAVIDLPKSSVGATINLMICSCLGKEIVSIKNCAKEPEVIDVGNFLISMGANISGLGTDIISITGVKSLHKTEYTIISDRIEAGTYLALGCLKANSPITVTNVNPDHLQSFLNTLEAIGHIVKRKDNSITVRKGIDLKPVHIITEPYPGFPTDLGPIITIVLSQIPGTSSLTEGIFENRFTHVPELLKLNGKIAIEKNKIFITGITNFSKGIVTGHDLRCFASLLLASIIASGDVTIKNLEVFNRGYESALEKLKTLSVICEKKETN